MRKSIRFVSAAAVAAASFVAFPGAASAQNWQHVVCSQEYAPVCGVKHGVARIYPNTCEARAQGAHIVRKSNCSRRPVSVRG